MWVWSTDWVLDDWCKWNATWIATRFGEAWLAVLSTSWWNNNWNDWSWTAWGYNFFWAAAVAFWSTWWVNHLVNNWIRLTWWAFTVATVTFWATTRDWNYDWSWSGILFCLTWWWTEVRLAWTADGHNHWTNWTILWLKVGTKKNQNFVFFKIILALQTDDKLTVDENSDSDSDDPPPDTGIT